MGIGKIIHKFLTSIGIIAKHVEEHLPDIITILGKVMSIVDNPTIDAIAACFVGSQNEIAIKEALDHVLIIATQGTAIAEDVKNAKSAVDKLKIFAEDLKKYHITMQHMNLGKIAALVIKYLEGDGMSVNDATIAVEYAIKEARQAS